MNIILFMIYWLIGHNRLRMERQNTCVASVPPAPPVCWPWRGRGRCDRPWPRSSRSRAETPPSSSRCTAWCPPQWPTSVQVWRTRRQRRALSWSRGLQLWRRHERTRFKFSLQIENNAKMFYSCQRLDFQGFNARNTDTSNLSWYDIIMMNKNCGRWTHLHTDSRYF